MPRSWGKPDAERMRRLQPIVWRLAKTTDWTVRDIARITGLPHETTRRWVARVRKPAEKLPYGVGAGFKNLNEKLREAGIPVAERARILMEARHA